MKTRINFGFLFLCFLFVALLVGCSIDHNHIYQENWNYDNIEHWKECTCGEKIGEEKHIYGDWKIIEKIEDDLIEYLKKERKCNVCGYVEYLTEEEAHVHEYGKWEVIEEPTLTKIGTISRICSKNTTHIEEKRLPRLNNINYSFVLTSPTCLESGKETYTYSIDNQEFVFSIPLEALGHSFSNEWDNDSEYHWHNAICEHTSEKAEFKKHDYENYICKICNYEYYSIGLEFELNSDGISYSVSSIGTATDLEIVIPANFNHLPVTAIKEEAFANCIDIINIVIGKNIKDIGKNAFLNCSSLTDIEIPNSVNAIGYGAFSGCNKLVSMKLPFVGGNRNAKSPSPETVFGFIFGSEIFFGSEVIEQRYDSSSTSKIYYSMPNSLKNVEIFGGTILYGAFWNCKNLSRIILWDSVIITGHVVFTNCNMEELRIPSGFDSDDYWILASSGNSYSSLKKLSAPIKAMEDIGHLVQEAEITGGEYIGTNLFSWNVGNNGWYNASLKKVTISKSVKKIGHRAFESCRNLVDVYYEGTIEDWCNIYFAENTSNPMCRADHFYLRNSDGEWEELKSIEIPNGKDRTGYFTFYGFNNVESLILPESLKWISTESFKRCEGLRNIYYKGTLDQWNNIRGITESNIDMTWITVYYYSESQPDSWGYYWHYVNGIPAIW